MMLLSLEIYEQADLVHLVLLELGIDHFVEFIYPWTYVSSALFAALPEKLYVAFWGLKSDN